VVRELILVISRVFRSWLERVVPECRRAGRNSPLKAEAGHDHSAAFAPAATSVGMISVEVSFT